MAKLATHSLDVQYYLLAADNTGRALMCELCDAALRGVRVRLLVDVVIDCPVCSPSPNQHQGLPATTNVRLCPTVAGYAPSFDFREIA